MTVLLYGRHTVEPDEPERLVLALTIELPQNMDVVGIPPLTNFGFVCTRAEILQANGQPFEG